MLQKTFNFFLVVFLIVFTAAGAVLLVSGLMSLLKPAETSGVSMIAGGVSYRTFSIFIALILSLLVISVFVITRRIKHR
jgi:hypothetical protein